MSTFDSLQGADLVGADGERIGAIADIYTDDTTGEPAFALVKTGLLGTALRFVPLINATRRGAELHVNTTRTKVRESPALDAGERLTPHQEAEIYSYYGLGYSDQRVSDGTPEDHGDRGDGIPEAG